MYNYGGSFGSSCGCNNYSMPAYQPCCYPTNNYNHAIILVLFILLVIIIGCRINH